MKQFTTIEGDLLNAQQGFIIHGCNDQGVMGSGVAAGVRARYPGAYAVYKQADALDKLKLGSCTFYQHNPLLWIVNGVTQTLGGPNPLSMDALKSVFSKTLDFMIAYESASGIPYGSLPLLFPMIGAGRAGGNWSDISDVIDHVLFVSNTAYNINRTPILYTVKVEPNDCR